MGKRFRIHSRAGVAYRQHYVWPRSRTQMLAAICVVQVGVGGLDDQLSPTRHGVPRIDRQVHEHLAQLPGIRFYASQVGLQPDGQFDIFTDHAMEHLFNFHDGGIEVDYCWFDDLLAAERQELHSQGRGSLRRVPGTFHAFAQSVVSAYLLVKDVAVTKDNAKQVVEIVRYSARQPADGLHFLRLEKLLFKTPAFCNVFGEDLEISKRMVLLPDRMPRHSDDDDVPVFFSPFGFNFSKIPFLPMVADQALAGFWIAINILFYIAPRQLLFRFVAEQLHKSRVHLQELSVQRDSINPVRRIMH